MNLPTKYDVFNHVKNHLLKQNAKSLSKPHGCMYHARSGKRCAVGCLIEDTYYTEELEGVTYLGSNSSVAIAVDLSLGRTLEQDEKEMLEVLQSIHDNGDVKYWAKCLNDLEHDLFGETNADT